MFVSEPICEICGKKKATSFSYFYERHESGITAGWKFVCDCTKDIESYDIPISSFFNNPASTVDWLAQIEEKNWMNGNDFLAMFRRFREATDSYDRISHGIPG